MLLQIIIYEYLQISLLIFTNSIIVKVRSNFLALAKDNNVHLTTDI